MREPDVRITAYAALAVALLFAPGVVLQVLHPSPPPRPAEEFVAFVVTHRTEMLVGSTLSALGWGGVLIVFAGGLFSILRHAEGAPGIWSAIAFGGCVATATTILVVIALLETLVHLVPALDESSLLLLYDGSLIANLMTAFPNAVYAVATGIVVWKTAVMPRWVAYGAFAVAAVHLGSSMSLARGGPFSPLGVLPMIAPLTHFAWLIGIAVALLRAESTRAGSAVSA